MPSSSFLHTDEQGDDVFLSLTLESICVSLIASSSEVKKVSWCTLNKAGSTQKFL